MDLLRHTNRLIRDVVEKHDKVLLFVSGGKDSLLLTYLAKDYASSIRLVHNEIDHGWPGVTEHLGKIAISWGYEYPVIVHPEISLPQMMHEFGCSASIIPENMDNSSFIPSVRIGSNDFRLISKSMCELIRIARPLIHEAQKQKADAVLTGQRKVDAAGLEVLQENDPCSKKVFGYFRYNPLAVWTDIQVWSALDEFNVPLPDIYALWKRNAEENEGWEPSECTLCTGHPQILSVLKEHYPELYKEAAPIMIPVLQQIHDSSLKQISIIADVLEG